MILRSWPRAGLASLVLSAVAIATPLPVRAQEIDSLQVLRAMLRQGDPPGAELAARRLVERERTRAPADSMRLAETFDVLVEALWRNGKARSSEATTLARDALGIQERQRGPQDLSVATTLLQLSIVQRQCGDYDDARAGLDRALSIRVRALGPMHADVAQVLNSQGVLLNARGDYAGAEAAYRRALSVREKTLGPSAPEVANTLSNLGATLVAEGKPLEARPLYERALDIQQQSLGPEHPDLASTLQSLANLDAAAGEDSTAQALYERVLAIRERRLGPNHPDVATAADNLGLLLMSAHHFDAARANIERGLAIREAALGPEHVDVAASLNLLARLLTATGDYAGARPLYERSLGLRERALGRDHPLVAASLNDLGRLLGALGDLDEARRDLERALDINERRLGATHPNVAINLDNLALVLDASGAHTQALERMRRAVAIQDSSATGNPPAPNLLLVDLATMLRGAGRADESDSLLREVLGRVERAYGRDDPRTATCLAQLAFAEADRQRWAEGRAHYERAIAIDERALGTEHRDVLYMRHDLAQLLAASGDTSAALTAALSVEQDSRGQLSRSFLVLPERQALNLAFGTTGGYDLMLALAARGLPAPSRRAVFDALIRTRALVLDAMSTRRSVLASATDSTTAQLLASYRAAGERLAGLAVRDAGDGVPDSARASERARARFAAEAAERALAERCSALRQRAGRDSLGFDAVSAAIPTGAALVSFARFLRVGARAPAVRGTGDPALAPVMLAEYEAFVLRPNDAAPTVVPLGSGERIDRLVSAWQREAARGPTLRVPARAVPAYRTAGASLRQAVWDPLASELRGISRVLIVPDGTLELVSFATLPVGGDRYLLQDGPRIHYLSTERDLAESPGPPARTGGLLAIADPDFNATPVAAPAPADAFVASTDASERGGSFDCPDFAHVRFGALPATRREADEIVGLWREAHSRQATAPRSSAASGAADPDGALELTGSLADETSFKRMAPGRSILHLATHGFFLGAGCGAGPLAIRGIGALSVGLPPLAPATPALHAKSSTEPVQALAGLALAGANLRSRAGARSDDGVLTAEEVGSLDLSGVEWAVLSACETGVGDVVPGEGVLGLRRAFQIAGARTLIMSLWPVEDDATREWMRALYRARLSRGLATDEAARVASLEVLKAREKRGESTHPFFWGAFVAAGDWK